ncbi:hypothetical protein F9B85_06675 [Heliorestis acidaminivorans]|uniref:Uncharacterized protein n=1 Tax=Heliorestis acidaminivorans TaxID=553427 RepID=A0A6I0F188_9FIRM|nr:hypothetical protein [Heliorestis acidaminivorans]KAB2952947.1 hypothetical protein F9B85_06675 [Heliorestis acidaminivorans]
MNVNKFMLAKVIGEILRLQNKLGICGYSEKTIYGLLNGIEPAIDEFFSVEAITQGQVKAVIDVLNPYHLDKEKLSKFKGFYDIEHDLENQGIDRWQAIKILTYLYNNRQFQEVIDKMDSSYSPTECRTFHIDDFEK